MNLDKIVDFLNIDRNDTFKNIGGTIGTLTGWLVILYTILGDIVIPALQQVTGLLGS